MHLTYSSAPKLSLFLEATIVALLANIVRNAPFLTIIVDGMQLLATN